MRKIAESCFSARLWGVLGNGKGRVPVKAIAWNHAGESRSPHAGQMANTFQKLRLERDNLLRLRIAFSAQKVLHGQNISRRAAKIDRAKLKEALEQEPGANQEDDRKCELDDQKAFAQRCL